MTPRIDSAARLISASPETVYRAFTEPGAMERWLPPGNMTGKVLHFDFREGGSYRMRLTYTEPQQGRGKTSEDSDEVEVRLTKLEDGRRIEQEINFESEDPAFSRLRNRSVTDSFAQNLEKYPREIKNSSSAPIIAENHCQNPIQITQF